MSSRTQQQALARAPAAEIHPYYRLLRGAVRLGFDGVMQMTSLVEAMHHNIARAPLPFVRLEDAPAPGITGLVYRSIRGVSSLVGNGLDSMLELAQPLLPVSPDTPTHEAWRAALNGVLGDHLENSSNPLAIPMCFRQRGQALSLRRDALAAALPHANGKLMVVVHGLCMNDRQWTRNGHNHAEALAAEFGYTPVYLHYNSGRHISTNGREFAALLQQLVEQWPTPLESLTLLTHSMGGLLTRSACHYAELEDRAWPRLLDKIVFLGTPHHGAPLERHGNRFQRLHDISPYIAPLGRLGMLRSAGITDLRYGNLVDEDWQGRDRFAPGGDARRVVALPQPAETYTAAATLGRQQGDRKDRWLADGLVPLYSALGQHRDPARALAFLPEHQWIGYQMSHWDLLDNPALFMQLKSWLRQGKPAVSGLS